jgi:hypothetical protein
MKLVLVTSLCHFPFFFVQQCFDSWWSLHETCLQGGGDSSTTNNSKFCLLYLNNLVFCLQFIRIFLQICCALLIFTKLICGVAHLTIPHNFHVLIFLFRESLVKWLWVILWCSISQCRSLSWVNALLRDGLYTESVCMDEVIPLSQLTRTLVN